ncbi:MAG: hypothetical protein U5K31_09585 [Balneolaceae bacterium]|nr:hypothetical protein [Balneolaceae bacterium]
MQTSLRDPRSLSPGPAGRRGGHAHTIASSLLGDTRKPPCRRVEIPTPDGDFLELDLAGENNEGPCVVLFHGLEGSSDRYYTASMMRALAGQGFSVSAVNFRSRGSRLNRRARFDHSGRDGRLLHGLLTRRGGTSQGRRLAAVGFSAGRQRPTEVPGEERRDSPLYAAAAVSAPYDPLKPGSTWRFRGCGSNRGLRAALSSHAPPGNRHGSGSATRICRLSRVPLFTPSTTR